MQTLSDMNIWPMWMCFPEKQRPWRRVILYSDKCNMWNVIWS